MHLAPALEPKGIAVDPKHGGRLDLVTAGALQRNVDHNLLDMADEPLM